MKPILRPSPEEPPESIEFVPKRELDRAQQENERLRKQSERLQKENERLKKESELLRRKLEAALRASKRQASPHSRATPKPIRSAQGANPVAATAGGRAARSRGAWTNGSPFHCRNAARIAAAG